MTLSKSKVPPPGELRLLLEYDPITGELVWKARSRERFNDEISCKRWNARFAGKPALNSKNSNGYLRGTIGGATIAAHRVAYAIHFGNWPAGLIDHVNGIKTDNRIENLRLATQAQNLQNRGKNKNNTSGFKGVYWNKKSKAWLCYIGINGERKFLGTFAQATDAATAYAKAAASLHHEFSRFA